MKRPKGKSKDLRKKAEAKIGLEDADLSRMSPDNIKKLVHELRVHQIELEMQNDEIRRTHEELERSRSEYVDLYDFAPVGYLTLDNKGIVLKMNLTAASMLGIERNNLINKPFSICIAEGSSYIFFTFLKKVFEEKTQSNCEIQIKKGKNGDFYARLDFNGATEDNCAINQCRIAIGDITDRKMAEDKLKELVNEKEFLIREVHHRVKNNFQTIISLLSLQEQNITNKSVLDEFSIIKSRIKAFAIIHDKLYQSDNLKQILLSEYISSLVQELFQTYKSTQSDIKFEMNIQDNLSLTLNNAIYLGLVINEIITNSFKHAFPVEHAGAGIISISAHSGHNDTIMLIISDNGIGMPTDTETQKNKTLGMSLIHLLIEKQINGTLEICRDTGTRYIISFKSK
jgi:PAS domain S-box-containing protein